MQTTRSASVIKNDMLEWVRQNIYATMGQEWDFNGVDFDPLVHLLVSACASEVKNIYDAIDSSDRRIVKKLAELLVPEQAHLPSPAHALAMASPTGSAAKLSESMEFRCNAESGEFYFTPAFNCVILNSKLKVVGSDELIFHYDGRPQTQQEKITHISRLLLGFESPKAIASFDNVLFYFDLGGDNRTSAFLDAIAAGSWKLNGHPIEKIRGFRKNIDPLNNLLDPQSYMVKHAENVYRPNFFTIQEDPGQEVLRRSISDIVITWLRDNNTSSPVLEQQAQTLPMVGDNLFWIEIQLPYTIPVNDLQNNFRCATNIFPVVNRKLQVKDDADVFLNKPVLSAVSIHPEKPFLGVHKVMSTDNHEELRMLPLNQLNGSKTPAYNMRYAGVGRIDNFNSWSRFAYLIELFREEHRYREIVEKLGDKVSIEELHLLIGEKMQQYEQSETNTRNTVYFFLYPGQALKNGLRVCIKYWTTDGSKANRISANKTLVFDPADPSIMKENFILYTAPKGGRDAAEETDYYRLLRHGLMTNDKLVTTEDIKRFCYEYVGKPLENVTVNPGFYIDPRPQGGISRSLEVCLHINSGGSQLTLQDTCRELEHLINERSNGSMPYIVKTAGGVK